MKNILIPTDFSENSKNALKYAQLLFDAYACNFYILHVDTVLNAQGESIPHLRKHRPVITDKSPKELLEDLLHATIGENTNPQHSFYALYEYGFFIDRVKAQLSERKIDLIVMGTKGVSGLREKVVGSSAGDVITKVQYNTIVVPESVRFERPEEITFPTDFNIFYSHSILSSISEMLELNAATLRILNVMKNGTQLNAEQEKNKTYLLDFMEETFPESHSFHTVSNKNVKSAIQLFVESRDIDMIIMVAKNLNFIQQMLFDSIVEKISFHTKIPFYVIHD